MKRNNHFAININDEDEKYEKEQNTKHSYILYSLLTAVSAIMTIMNVLAEEYIVMWATLIFTVCVLFDIALIAGGDKGIKTAKILLGVQALLLFSTFVVTGSPDGFSAIWVCLLPMISMVLFDKKEAVIVSGIMMAELVTLFYLPFGRGLLLYEYDATFMIRFPVLYAASFAIEYFLRKIRDNTYEMLIKSREKYQVLFCTDALTGIYNRYGFKQMIADMVKNIEEDTVFLILDIDKFKDVNDKYGHIVGDKVLKNIAEHLVVRLGRENVSRWGGEEFAAVLRINGGDGTAMVESLCESFRGNVMCNTIAVTVSIGATVIPAGTAVDFDTLMNTTDKRMYCAKEGGRDKVVIDKYNVI